MRRLLMAFAMMLTTAPACLAQQPVFVTDHDGARLNGVLLDLGPETMTLLVDGQKRDVALTSIARIDAPGDSVKNGTIIGAVVAGVWCALVCGQGLDHAGDVLIVTAVNTGIGALIGAGIDAMHVGSTPIFRREKSDQSAAAVEPRPTLVFRYRF